MSSGVCFSVLRPPPRSFRGHRHLGRLRRRLLRSDLHHPMHHTTRSEASVRRKRRCQVHLTLLLPPPLLLLYPLSPPQLVCQAYHSVLLPYAPPYSAREGVEGSKRHPVVT
jgi:hypothetical protein